MARFLRYPKYLAAFLVGCLLLSGVPTRAASSVLTVSGETILAQGEVYFLDGITITQTGHLVIPSDAVLLLSPGAIIRNEGKLDILGSHYHPVHFNALVASDPWDSLITTATSGAVTIKWAEFSSFRHPLTFLGPVPTLSQVRLIDGLSNTIVIGDTQRIFSGRQTFTNLTFENHLLGTRMGDEGMWFHGRNGNFSLKDSQFLDTRTLPESTPLLFGLRSDGSGTTIQALNVTYGAGCMMWPYFSATDLRETGQNPAGCTPTTIPVVFVPGYGTSINLPRLTSVKQAAPTLDGWRFYQGITPAYSSFLQSLAYNHVPYTVAYYDWRQPAQTIARDYLKPIIDQAKRTWNAPAVYLVAHSFGGLVAQSYIASDLYEGDVAQLVQLGTPNQGAAKAYSVWEGGQLPPDWQAVSPLIQWYQYQSKTNITAQAALQTYVPSAQEMLPSYPALIRANQTVVPSSLVYQNQLTTWLGEQRSTIAERVPITSVVSRELPTLTRYVVGEAHPDQKEWPDGTIQRAIEANGDGTVPEESSLLDPTRAIFTTGSHANLPQAASEQVIRWLYPTISYLPLPTVPNASREASHILWFFFDCPVTVAITLPDGRVQSSEAENADFLDPNPETVGETITSGAMDWLLVPEISGTYTITVQAKETAEVRWWVGTSSITTVALKKGEESVWTYSTAPPEDQPEPAENSPLDVPAEPVTNQEAVVAPEVRASSLPLDTVPYQDYSGAAFLPHVVALSSGDIPQVVTFPDSKQSTFSLRRSLKQTAYRPFGKVLIEWTRQTLKKIRALIRPPPR